MLPERRIGIHLQEKLGDLFFTHTQAMEVHFLCTLVPPGQQFKTVENEDGDSPYRMDHTHTSRCCDKAVRP